MIPEEPTPEELTPDVKPELSRSAAGLLGCLVGFAAGAFFGVIVTLIGIVARINSESLSNAAFWVVFIASPLCALVCWRIGIQIWDRRFQA